LQSYEISRQVILPSTSVFELPPIGLTQRTIVSTTPAMVEPSLGALYIPLSVLPALPGNLGCLNSLLAKIQNYLTGQQGYTLE
jgi:hypothetical protein